MGKNITFTDLVGVGKEFYPKPASSFIPDWYKDTQSYSTGKKEVLVEGEVTSTIKRCMPVFDALTLGYIIPTYVDIYVRQENGAPYYSWASHDAISFHPNGQLSKHPRAGIFDAPKWKNPFSIKTPEGYSVLLVPPIHHPNEYFEILEGVVDSDRYTAQVNLPFILKDTSFEGLIPAGTPLVQVIPFKRDSWQMSLGGESEKLTSFEDGRRLTTRFFDRYKNLFRVTKEFK